MLEKKCSLAPLRGCGPSIFLPINALTEFERRNRFILSDRCNREISRSTLVVVSTNHLEGIDKRDD